MKLAANPCPPAFPVYAARSPPPLLGLWSDASLGTKLVDFRKLGSGLQPGHSRSIVSCLAGTNTAFVPSPHLGERAKLTITVGLCPLQRQLPQILGCRCIVQGEEDDIKCDACLPAAPKLYNSSSMVNRRRRVVDGLREKTRASRTLQGVGTYTSCNETFTSYHARLHKAPSPRLAGLG